MQLSAYPELRSARNDLARRIQKKPGDKYYLDAIVEANRIVQHAFRETNGNVRRAVREVGKVTRGGKPQKSQRPASAVSEAVLARVVSAAVGRAVGEALAPQVRQSAPAAPAKRPVHELDDADLAAVFEAVVAEGMVSPLWMAEAAPQPQSAAAPVPVDKPLHELDLETADTVMAAGTDSYATAYGLVSPFWGQR